MVNDFLVEQRRSTQPSYIRVDWIGGHLCRSLDVSTFCGSVLTARLRPINAAVGIGAETIASRRVAGGLPGDRID